LNGRLCICILGVRDIIFYQNNRRIKQEGLKSEMVNEDWSMTKILKLPSIFKFYDNKYGGRSKLNSL